MAYDCLIIGAGLSGATAARVLADAGKRVLVLEKEGEVGGLCREQGSHGILVHRFGPHIFHTSNPTVWSFLSRFARFNHFSLRPRARVGSEVFSFPINLQTIVQVAGVSSPYEARRWVEEQRVNVAPTNFETALLSRIGRRLYETFYQGYTLKMWCRDPQTLSASLASRIPVRFDFNDRYFDDPLEGVPSNGYSVMIAGLLSSSEVRCGADWLRRSDRPRCCRGLPTIYTGPLDALHDFRFGPLPYRTLTISGFISGQGPVQGCAVMNFPDCDVSHTRCIEHTYFDCPKRVTGPTVITAEFPRPWDPDRPEPPMYPIPTAEAEALAAKYRALRADVLSIGRLGSYRYLNMDRAVEEAMAAARSLLV